MAASMDGQLPVPRLKDFIFTEKLGSGTYATVYKAYRKGGKREVVAVKCIQKSSLNRTSTENLLTEIELLKKLKHPHIVQLSDFQWDDKHIYLIMEYCSGGDLSRFIKSRRTLSEYLVKRFLQQIASALQYMRSQNVSHLDLKPQNILLSTASSPILKIADFGFAHYLLGDTDTKAAILRGSPLYMAPEIVCHRHYSASADLWSVGVIMYECLFGRAPFHSRSFSELENKIKDTKPIELPYGVDVPDECRELLTGLLQRDPEKRISFEEFFSHPFVDLDHMPAKDSLNKARELVTRAVEMDSQSKLNEAVQLYCQALEHFVPAIHYEHDVRVKEVLRQKVKEYIRRAEELKRLLKPRLDSASDHSTTAAQQGDLDRLYKESPELRAAQAVLKEAKTLEENEDFEKALKKYEAAIGSLLKISQSLPKGGSKDSLQKEIDRLLSHAEQLSSYAKVQGLNTSAGDMSKQEEAEKTNLQSSCCVQ